MISSAFFTLAKQEGIHTTLDTAGEPFRNDETYLERFDKLMAVTDLFMLDLKAMDSVSHLSLTVVDNANILEMAKYQHLSLTGVDNANILEMAKYLSAHGKKMWIRHVLVPGVTDDENDLISMHEFIKTLDTVEKVEILPYHTLGTLKWAELGIPYTLEGVPVPDDEQIKRANELLHTNEYTKNRDGT